MRAKLDWPLFIATLVGGIAFGYLLFANGAYY
jgi:hypothetical protein